MSKIYLIERKNRKTGFVERIVYTGVKSNIPKGWKFVKEVLV